MRETSMLPAVTPLILTYNEAPNIGRLLTTLAWAREIIVLDSFSCWNRPLKEGYEKEPYNQQVESIQIKDAILNL